MRVKIHAVPTMQKNPNNLRLAATVESLNFRIRFAKPAVTMAVDGK